MEENRMKEELMSFGLTRQEATVYLALCRYGTMSGYEVAKQTGISRSNAYNALAGLTDKGAAFEDKGTVVRYAPVDAEEFCNSKLRILEKKKVQLVKSIPRGREETDGYLTVTSDEHIAGKIHYMCQQTEKRMYLSMPTEILAEFYQQLQQLVQKGRKLVIITDHPVTVGDARVYLHHCDPYQIGLITDSKNVLTGEYKKGADSVCLYSEAPNFVKIFKSFLSNQIKLIELSKGETK
ncbi:MAG: TrmB family transcriptional regulator [Lachnospiraceae bacterium]